MNEADKARLFFLRLTCNWTWPLIVLAKFVYDIVSLVGGAEISWRWLGDVAWYAFVIYLWSSDVKCLRALRDKEKP